MGVRATLEGPLNPWAIHSPSRFNPGHFIDTGHRRHVANDETIFREVDQELAEDKLWTRLRRQGPALIGIAVLIVAVVAVSQYLSGRTQARENAAARDYADLQQTLTESPEDAVAALELFVEEAPDGYGALARFQLAARLASEGERDRALEQYRTIYGDDDLPGRFRDLARLRAAHISIDNGRDAVIADIGDLETAASPLALYAREILGLASLDAGDFETAQAAFRRLMSDPTAPPSMKARAEEFAALASEAKAGVDISWPEDAGRTTVDDLIDALGPDALSAGDLNGALLNDAPLTPDDAGESVTDAINEALGAPVTPDTATPDTATPNTVTPDAAASESAAPQESDEAPADDAGEPDDANAGDGNEDVAGTDDNREGL